MRFFKTFPIILLVVLVVLLTACSGSGSSRAQEKQDDIVIGQISWPENIAVTNMWKAILEDEGYEVDLKLLDIGPMMASLNKGDLDMAPEIWLPVQDRNYYEEYKDGVDFAEEPWYENGKVGLAVPAYMDEVNSIADLNANKEKFDGEITGFEAGAGTMKVTKEVIDDYDLDYELVDSSESAMIAAIKEAVKQKEDIVAPLWKPHFLFSEVDLKFLDDPKGTYGETEELYMATRAEFDEDYADVDSWMRNWEMSDDELGELISDVQEHKDNPLKGAQKWVDENEDVVQEWMK